MKKLLLKLSVFFIDLGKIIEPNYWKCTHCKNIKFKEEEIYCWKCNKGLMIYKG
jgi:hypothetical protein